MSTSKALSLSGVEKKYRGFTLGPMDLDLNPGSVVGLIGPNGAGKTTTINVIAGLLTRNTGDIEIFGIPTNPNNPKWKFDIGYVGDTHAFYEYWSGQKNLGFLKQFYPTWDDERVKELTDRFQLDLKKRVSRLSKGNRAKLALIGVLAYSPKLLLLDEPTSGLDPVVRAEFLDVMWELIEKGDSAVLYSTHILSDISRIADELIFLRDGQIESRTETDKLLDSWRQVSFSYAGEPGVIPGVISIKSENSIRTVISSEFELTKKHLEEIKAENVVVSMMSVDDIAVNILKGK